MSELSEALEVVLLARMNPPHRGHQKLLEGLPHGSWVGLSTSHDSGANPVPAGVRKDILERKYPGLCFYLAKNMYEALEFVLSHHKKIVLIGGEDREADLLRIIRNYPEQDCEITHKIISGTGICRGTVMREKIRLGEDVSEFWPTNFDEEDKAIIEHWVLK